MLAARGATVLATGTAADTGRLKSLGAGTVVDARSPRSPTKSVPLTPTASTP